MKFSSFFNFLVTFSVLILSCILKGEIYRRIFKIFPLLPMAGYFIILTAVPMESRKKKNSNASNSVSLLNVELRAFKLAV